jgi:hypothetical protein
MLFPQEQTRPDIARKRDRWRRYQGLINLSRLVFIDDPNGGEAIPG